MNKYIKFAILATLISSVVMASDKGLTEAEHPAEVTSCRQIMGIKKFFEDELERCESRVKILVKNKKNYEREAEKMKWANNAIEALDNILIDEFEQNVPNISESEIPVFNFSDSKRMLPYFTNALDRYNSAKGRDVNFPGDPEGIDHVIQDLKDAISFLNSIDDTPQPSVAGDASDGSGLTPKELYASKREGFNQSVMRENEDAQRRQEEQRRLAAEKAAEEEYSPSFR
ncbi:MAG: hypothetical protein CNLJKLNK_01074 [Holosporales bacterium]